jgi:hypothetical protein
LFDTLKNFLNDLSHGLPPVGIVSVTGGPAAGHVRGIEEGILLTCLTYQKSLVYTCVHFQFRPVKSMKEGIFVKEFDRVKSDFNTWTVRLSASQFRMTTLGGKDEPPAGSLHVESPEVVETFLKQHPEGSASRAELLVYAKQARPNGVYVMNEKLWNETCKAAGTA